MTQTKQHCSTPDQLLTFLRGQLSTREEAELQQHLDECPSCRERLESTAADASVWHEAREFFGNGALHASTRGASDEHEETHQGSQRIRQVLNSLGPTDDPESLGRIGGYEITGVVGAGGMGVVLKAHDRSLDRIVAIKVMAPHLASSGSARKRFAREAKAAAAVLHPNVIAIHSVASEDANPYLVMPFVRGASLQKRIDSQGPLPLKDTLRIGSQIAAGLAAAHEQGLVHRDIKPANILLEEGVERVTITDFGLARAVDDASMTCSGVIAGTPQYMSPEQARGEPIDARSDLFSLGSVLYAMCTGRSPFRAETTYGVLHRIANESPTSVCEVNSDVPVWLGHVIERLMAKRPEDRFGSAAEVAELLEGCLAHVQQPAIMPLPEAVAALAPIRARRPPISKLLTAAAFAFAIIFAGVLVVLELNKGTLTIQSEVDDIRVRITRGEQIVNELKVAKGEKSIRVAAGQYQVEVIGETDGLTVENGRVTLYRADSEVVRIVHESHNTNAVEDELIGNELLAQLQGTYDQTQVDAHIDPTANDGTPSSAAMAKELDADARQAMSTHQNRLVWTKRFKLDSIRRYTHKEVGRLEERSTLASDGKRFVHRHESLKMDQPADFVGRSLTSFGLYTGDSFMGGTCLTGQPMSTGGYSRQSAEEHAWGMRERTCMKLEGYRAGNAGQTILELLLKSKDLEVKKEKIGEVDCFRIKNRDEWGTHVAWIEAKGKNRLLQWESRKARGNKFSRSRHGEHRDTSNYESSGVRITGIEYREIDGTPIAIRGTYVSFHTPNGGQETVSSMEMERSNIELKPDFSSDSIFDPLYAEGARITDLDGTDPDKHFWWRNGQLVASDPVKPNQPSTSNKPRPLSTAIGQFNELHNARLPASNTPLLTEDEVRAALWWHANQVDLSPGARMSLLEIVQTRMLPAGWSLQLDSVQWDEDKLWHNKPATSKAIEIKLVNAEQIAVKIRSQFTSSGLASKDRPDSQLLAAIAEFNKTKAENQPPLTLNETMAALSEHWRKDSKTGKDFLNLSETATRKLMGVADMHVMDGVRIESSYVNHEVEDSKSLSWRIELSVDPVKEMVAAEKLVIRERFIRLTP